MQNSIFANKIDPMAHPKTENLSENRAFLYGDAFFETIIVENGRPLLWDFHLERIKRSMKALFMVESSEFTVDNIPQIIKNETDKNPLEKNQRVRIHFYRSFGGLYAPELYTIQYEISCKKAEMPCVRFLKNAGFSNQVFLSNTIISALKTNNCLPYVLAGIEKQQEGFDDIILLDSLGNVAEANSSNIFWIKNNQIYTSILQTGCIAGVRRASILKNNPFIKECFIKKEDLLNSDLVFSTNVAGIYIFEQILDQKFDHNPYFNILESFLKY